MSNAIDFREQTARREAILEHLQWCNKNHLPVLSDTVNLPDYADKISAKAYTFEAWSTKGLIGLVAAYLNEKPLGFITNVSVTNEFMGMGIANRLMQMCFEQANSNAFSALALEVTSDNEKAIKLYRKFGFVESERNNATIKMKHQLRK